MATVSDSFTQGGQTQLHKLHMIRQVLGTTLYVSILVGLIALIVMIFNELSINDLLMVLAYKWSKLCVESGVTQDIFKNVTFPFPEGRMVVPCWWVASNPRIIKFVSLADGILLKGFLYGGISSIFSFLSISLYWVWKGYKRRQSKILEGQSIVEPSQLKVILQKENKASKLTLAGVPLLKDSELQHFLAVGTTGSGKTNALFELLNQVKDLNQKAVIIDTTGTYVGKYYREGVDKILNPFDSRCISWNVWADCKLPYEFEAFAECLIPQTGYDPFWTNAARMVFSNIAQKLQMNPSTKSLRDIALSAPLTQVYTLLKGTEASSMVDPDSEKPALSIRATLAANLKGFKYLGDDNSESVFSIKDWVKNENDTSWLFLTCQPEQRAALVSLITAWINVAVNALMSQKPDHQRRIWFVVDEMQTLKKMHELPNHLEEIRKYGGCYVMGVQNLSKLDSIYGADLVKSIASLVGTKLILRSSDAQVAKRLSGFLGEQYLSESGESISYGAHQFRDGVNLTEQKRYKPLVSANDIMTLNDLEGYFQLPGDWPITKVKFKYHTMPDIAPTFVMKDIPPDDYEDLIEDEIEEEGEEQVSEVLANGKIINDDKKVPKTTSPDVA